MAFSVTRARSVDGTRIAVAGELDLATAPQLTAVIDEALGEGDRWLLVDLTDLDFCDSTGLAAFVRGDNLAAARGGWLRVTGATGRVERVLRISGLAEILRFEPDKIVDPAVSPDR